MPKTLSIDDAESLAFEASKITRMPKVSLAKKICYNKVFCKTDKLIETQKRLFDEFKNKLNVGKIVNN